MHPAVVELLAAAKAAGVQVEQKGPGHYHLHGAWLVNYYPTSKNRTAYVKGTTEGRSCTPREAVQLALGPPPKVPPHLRDTRASSRPIRAAMMGRRQQVKCHWCPTMLTLDTSTLDHIVPISRGGLDAPNNRVLACEPCNTARGNDMPELESPPVYTLFGRPATKEEFEAAPLPKGEGLPWN